MFYLVQRSDGNIYCGPFQKAAPSRDATRNDPFAPFLPPSLLPLPHDNSRPTTASRRSHSQSRPKRAGSRSTPKVASSRTSAPCATCATRRASASSLKQGRGLWRCATRVRWRSAACRCCAISVATALALPVPPRVRVHRPVSAPFLEWQSRHSRSPVHALSPHSRAGQGAKRATRSPQAPGRAAHAQRAAARSGGAMGRCGAGEGREQAQAGMGCCRVACQLYIAVGRKAAVQQQRSSYRCSSYTTLDVRRDWGLAPPGTGLWAGSLPWGPASQVLEWGHRRSGVYLARIHHALAPARQGGWLLDLDRRGSSHWRRGPGGVRQPHMLGANTCGKVACVIK